MSDLFGPLGPQLYLGDCLEIMRQLPSDSVDSVVCDPPYGLSKEPDIAEVMRHWLAGDDYKHRGNGFMGKSWDSFVPGPAIWKEAFRVLKPGGHLSAFFGTRTYDLGTLAIRLAGFEIRDQLAWTYGSGFPKSLDVSKAIDKAAGAEREVIGSKMTGNAKQKSSKSGEFADGKHGGNQVVDITAPATEAVRKWEGYGTALKPAWEPICSARKPLIGTVAENVVTHGTGALNIDGCRVAANGESLGGGMVSMGRPKASEGWDRPWMHDPQVTERKKGESAEKVAKAESLGRWPANIVHDGSDEVVACFPDAKSTGSAARFFYCAKASKRDRGEGNNHPTVKPTDLMRWLARLTTPCGGIVLDPFMGSGSTGVAALREGFHFIGIEQDKDYFNIASKRIANA